ncbi:NUDIX domain-containing protein [Psychrobacter sp. B38]|uniref:NUDIX domain-containing protein n=1 Tax=Psychrobacter sp. B38 TaxID=3143538 RepID=UPI00320E26B7
MQNKPNQPIKSSHTNTVNVAVAVIHYKEQYLLGFRSAAQHQGNLYEFVGGKIDTDESAEQAVLREVAEETGIGMSDNTVVKLGRLHHDYRDKQVSLQVYKVELTAAQFEQHRGCERGLEGQALTWVSKSDLLAGKYPLPAANQTILKWLSVPTHISITYPLTHFSDCANPAAAWLQYHQEHIVAGAWVYVRTKEVAATDPAPASQLLRLRPDLLAILPYDDDRRFLDTKVLHATVSDNKVSSTDHLIAQNQVVANHLTHTALMQWFDNFQAVPIDDDASYGEPLSSNCPLIVSCHDEASIIAANKLASTRLQQQFSPVIGAFLSPVLATQTHPDAQPLGWESWSALAQLADMPIIGLGGLSPLMIEQALMYGGVSVAGIRQFFDGTNKKSSE